jgi:hypothetical protein
MTVTFQLTGKSLVAFVDDYMPLINRGEKTRTDMILDAGYAYDNGKARYVDFYTELLNARGVTPTTTKDTEDAEYESLTGTQQDLYDTITEKFGEKWTHEETIAFMEELDDIGIETSEALEDAFEHFSDEYRPEKEFAEYLVIEVMDARIPDIVMAAIDWQDVWDHNLRYDYNVIEGPDGMYFLRNI